MQARNGVIDVWRGDEAEATAVTKRLLAYFQEATPARPGTGPGPHARPRAERRRRAYEVGPVIETLADAGSVKAFLRGNGSRPGS